MNLLTFKPLICFCIRFIGIYFLLFPLGALPFFVCFCGGGGGGGGECGWAGCFSSCNSFSHPTPNLIWLLGSGSLADCIIFLTLSVCYLLYMQFFTVEIVLE
jgi:hypothetical protein